MTKPFRFKQFTVTQDSAAMKIGTDAVLLGAWTKIDKWADSILDIGSGTGVIALMMAQRCDAMTIDAVEVNEKAYLQTVANFENSPWGDRLFCYHSSFQDFAEELHSEGETYDIIVSNPPFYENSFEIKDRSRQEARSESALPFQELIDGVSNLLSSNGNFSVIIPIESEEALIQLAAQKELYVNRICHVKGNSRVESKRSLLNFSKEKRKLEKENLVIEIERHQYTQEYINLTKDFYLKM